MSENILRIYFKINLQHMSKKKKIYSTCLKNLHTHVPLGAPYKTDMNPESKLSGFVMNLETFESGT